MGKWLFAGLLLGALAVGSARPNLEAAQSSAKPTTLFVLTRSKIADAGNEEAKFEVTKAPTFELLVVEINSAKLQDKNSYLGRYYEHPVKREGKKIEFGVYAKAQLKAQTKLANFKPVGNDRAAMKFFAGPIGTVNPNPADKKARPDTQPFYIYEVEAFDPK